jgi:hypothetical protein
MVLRLFWLGVIEATRPELCPSFFQVDLAPAILGFLCRDDTPSPLDPATLGSLRPDNTLPLVPPTLGSLRRGDTPHPPPFPAYVSRHPARPPPTLSFPVPSILANTHPETLARPAPPTVPLAGRQNIAPAMPGLKPSPSKFTLKRGPRLFARNWSYRAYTSDLCNIRVNNA